MKKLAAILAFLWVFAVTAPAQQTIDSVGLTGTLNAPNGTPVNGQLTVALTLANVKNTCSAPPYYTVPRGPVTFTVTNGVIINGASANLVTQDCMSPRSAYYISVYDTNHKLLFADNWYFHEAAIINGHRSQDVGALVDVGFGGPIAVAISQGVFTNPQGNQTITQPAGTNLLINSAICTGTCIGFGGGGSSGGVTSVGLQLPSAVFNITTSPITSSGNLVAALSVQGAGTIFAGPPSGTTSGVPGFRLLQSNDIPNNAANTSGTSGNVTGIIAVANGGTGTSSPTGVTAGTGISISGSFPNQVINDTAVGSGLPSQLAFYGSGNTISGDAGITDNGTLITIGRAVLISGLTASQCVATDAGSHLTTVACGGGGGGGANPGGTVGSIQYQVNSTTFGGVNITGLVKSNGSGAPTQASGTGNLATGDFALPFSVTCTGSGLTCSYASNVFTWTLSGGAGSGTVTTALAHQVGYYPSAGTSISGNPQLYTIDPTMSQANINTLLAAVPAGSTIFEQDHTTEALQSNASNIQIVDFSKGGHYIDLAKYGVACDAQHFTITLTTGSNQILVGSSLSAASIGQTIAIGYRTGTTYNAPQYVWEPTVTAYTFPNATLSGNSPFTATLNIQAGTDNVAALTQAVADATYQYPVLVHAGCNYLTSPVPFTQAMSIIGQQDTGGGFVGMPGQDIFYQPDTGGTTSGGWRVENVGFNLNTSIDPTLPYTLYNATATSSSVVQPFYRPTLNNGQMANNPMASNWGTNLINGVANVTSGSAVACVPTALGRVPAIGNYMPFPYLSTSILWTPTVVNLTGAGCGAGYTGVTLNGNAPASATQAYFEAGIPSNFNMIASTIPTTITYPLTVTVNLPNAPSPTAISNSAPRGHVKIGNNADALEADYLGINYSTGTATATYVLRRGPSTIPTQMVANGAIIYPMNPCYANFETPPPVYPNINGTTSTTPAVAETYPGQCVGNAAIAWPQLNAFNNPTTGAVDASIGPIFVGVTDFQLSNGSAALYQAGNTAGYSVNYPQLKTAFTEFGFVQGPASAANWGLTYHHVGPTGTGPHITDCQMHSTYPIITDDFSQGSIDRCDTYTQGISPYDGSDTGAGQAIAMLYSLNEQTGGVVTNSFQDTIKDWNSEPEGGGENPAYADIECDGCTFIQANFEGAFSIFGGANIIYNGGQISNPVINYGTNNTFANVQGVNTGLMTNVWNSPTEQWINWGVESNCSMHQGGGGPLTNCSSGNIDSYNGHDTTAAQEGAGLNPWENVKSGEIVPGEWDINGALDSAPMSIAYVADTTEPYWGSYAGCNLGPSTFNTCRVQSFDGFNGLLYIGPHNRFYPGPTMLEANLKNATSSGTVILTISAFDSGTGECSTSGVSRAGQVQQKSVSLTSSWQHFSIPVDFTNKTGCVVQVQFGSGSVNDLMEVGEFTFVPIAQMEKVAVATFTAGTACARAGSWIGSDATNLYYCKGSAEGTGTVAALPYSGGGGGSGGISGTLTNNFIPVATGTSTVTSSLLSDNGTTLAYGGSGGISVGGSSPGSLSFIANSSNIPALAANSAGFAGPNTGGTSFLYKLPGTAAVGFMFSAAPATNDGVNESAISVKHMEATITGGTNSFGTYGAGTVLGGTKTVNAGHFTNLQSVNTSLTTCTTAPTFNVIDRTTSALGVSSVGSTTGNIGGTGSTIDTAQSLAFAAGDDISVEVQVTGGSCSNIFEVSAQYEVP